MNFFIYNYPLCKLGIVEKDGAICNVFFKSDIVPGGFKKAETSLIQKTASQLDEYFNGKRKVFDLPLNLNGTDFQIDVWKALQAIPFGETRSYGEIAAIIGKPKASRAVGMANNRNPIVIIVPCHRVIGRDGSLTGFGGGIELKRRLLELENVSYADRRVLSAKGTTAGQARQSER
jgi:methylated-DNA-[protein]-cysteine S-methyltransferase